MEDFLSEMLNTNQLYGELIGLVFSSTLKFLQTLVEVPCISRGSQLLDDQRSAEGAREVNEVSNEMRCPAYFEVMYQTPRRALLSLFVLGRGSSARTRARR